MRAPLVLFVGLAGGLALAMLPGVSAHLRVAAHALCGSAPASGRAHTAEEFSFAANGAMDQVAPLFGADKERLWAPEWAPRFIHPLPPSDVEGMVFTVAHGHIDVPWVNTRFDLKNGVVQYAYVIPDTLVTLITIKLAPAGDHTRIAVRYERTSLSPDGDAHVRRLAEHDAQAGPEWEGQVNRYLLQQK